MYNGDDGLSRVLNVQNNNSFFVGRVNVAVVAAVPTAAAAAAAAVVIVVVAAVVVAVATAALVFDTYLQRFDLRVPETTWDRRY